MKCDGPCTYSRQINQSYPRLCVHCKTPEEMNIPMSDPRAQEVCEMMDIDTELKTIKYWEARVASARQVMAAAIYDFDEARGRLADEERKFMSSVLWNGETRNRNFGTCSSCNGIYLNVEICPKCGNKLVKSKVWKAC